MSFWDDNQEVTLTTEFSYADVDRALGFMVEELDEHIEDALECQRRIWSWVWQPPAEDLDGLFCRCVIACWVFVPSLRDYTMTDMAGRVGKKKQSLGRWVDDFKKTFPEITAHMQHIKNPQ